MCLAFSCITADRICLMSSLTLFGVTSARGTPTDVGEEEVDVCLAFSYSCITIDIIALKTSLPLVGRVRERGWTRVESVTGVGGEREKEEEEEDDVCLASSCFTIDNIQPIISLGLVGIA
jgi:hypothetical protein